MRCITVWVKFGIISILSFSAINSTSLGSISRL